MTMKKGSKVKCTAQHGSSSGCYVPLGTILTVTKVQNGQFQAKEYASYWFFVKEFELTTISVEAINEEIANLKAAIEELEAKKTYLEETGQKEFDETEFKVFATLRTLQTDLSDLDKAKVIASLINSD